MERKREKVSSLKRRRMFRTVKCMVATIGVLGVVVVAGTVTSSDLGTVLFGQLIFNLLIGVAIVAMSSWSYDYLKRLERYLNRKDVQKLNQKKSA